MFHNIFSKLKPKKKKTRKPVVVSDIHEKNSLILSELYANKDIEVVLKPLKIGDYIIEDIVIERKTVSDFISSMLNKRLIEQLKQMQRYKNKLLIIEGDLSSLFNETKLNPNAIRGFILSIIRNYKTDLIFTKDYKDTSQYLTILAKQTVKPKTEVSLHSRIPKTLTEQKQYILESFPNIGPKKAKKLLEKFKTLSNIFNAKEEELKEILKKHSKDFKKILES